MEKIEKMSRVALRLDVEGVVIGGTFEAEPRYDLLCDDGRVIKSVAGAEIEVLDAPQQNS